MQSGCGAEDDSDSSGGLADPEPICPPPAWAAQLIADARVRVGREVYPPSDDTFLLLEVLAADAVHLRALRPSLCLEVGCGSGAVSAGLLEVLCGAAVTAASPEEAPQSCGKRGAEGGVEGKVDPSPSPRQPAIVAIDKNPFAAACSASILRDRGAALADVVRGSLLSGLRMAGSVDILVCNPPYVPTEANEMHGCGIEVSWAGGERGREVIDVLLPKVSELLVPGGLFYLVCMAENEPEDIMAVMQKFGLDASIAKREQRGIEELSVLRFQRPGGPSGAKVNAG